MHKSSFFQCKMPHNNNHGHITIRSNTLQWLTTDDKPFIQLDNILSQNSNYITSEYKYNQIPSPCSLCAGRATGILFLRKIYAIARTQRDIGSFRASSSISNRDPALSKPFRARVETPTMLLQRDFESRRPSIDRSIDRSPAYFPSNRPGLVNTPLVSAHEISLYPFLFTNITAVASRLEIYRIASILRIVYERKFGIIESSSKLDGVKGRIEVEKIIWGKLFFVGRVS